jgi:bifunctional ADP-heptose synthase (sugar kinase/adenylyltransferase)
VDFENTPAHEVLEQMLASFDEELARHDVVVFSDYGKGGLAHIPQMIQRARAAAGRCWSTPRAATTPAMPAPRADPQPLELAQVTGPWRDEAHLRTGAGPAHPWASKPCCTRSEEGMTLFDAQAPTMWPPRPARSSTSPARATP